jgi:stage V sporulation protein S
MAAANIPHHEESNEVVKQPLIWVRPDSNVQSIAALVSSSIEKDKRITLRAIGAGAVNQAVKSVIQARQQLASHGEDLIVRPGFTTVSGNDGNEVTAIVLHCLLN